MLNSTPFLSSSHKGKCNCTLLINILESTSDNNKARKWMKLKYSGLWFFFWSLIFLFPFIETTVDTNTRCMIHNYSPCLKMVSMPDYRKMLIQSSFGHSIWPYVLTKDDWIKHEQPAQTWAIRIHPWSFWGYTKRRISVPHWEYSKEYLKWPNVFVPLKFICCNFILQSDATRRWRLWEVIWLWK